MLTDKYEDLINAVIKLAYDDLHDAYIAYYQALANDRKPEKGIESKIKYLEDWLECTVEEWTNVSGAYLIRKCMETVAGEMEGYARRKIYSKRVFW